MDTAQFQTLVIDLLRSHSEEFRQIRQEMSAMRTELKGDIASLKTEVKDDISELRIEFKQDMKDLRSDFKEDIGQLRTELHSYSGKLDEVYDARNAVKIKFGWQWGMMSLLIAIVASTITEIFSI